MADTSGLNDTDISALAALAGSEPSAPKILPPLDSRTTFTLYKADATATPPGHWRVRVTSQTDQGPVSRDVPLTGNISAQREDNIVKLVTRLFVNIMR